VTRVGKNETVGWATYDEAEVSPICGQQLGFRIYDGVRWGNKTFIVGAESVRNGRKQESGARRQGQPQEKKEKDGLGGKPSKRRKLRRGVSPSPKNKKNNSNSARGAPDWLDDTGDEKQGSRSRSAGLHPVWGLRNAGRWYVAKKLERGKWKRQFSIFRRPIGEGVAQESNKGQTEKQAENSIQSRRGKTPTRDTESTVTLKAKPTRRTKVAGVGDASLKRGRHNGGGIFKKEEVCIRSLTFRNRRGIPNNGSHRRDAGGKKQKGLMKWTTLRRARAASLETGVTQRQNARENFKVRSGIEDAA